MPETNTELDDNEIIPIELKRGDAISICGFLETLKDTMPYHGDMWRKVNRVRSLFMTQILKNIPNIDQYNNPYDLPKE